jgi:thiol-disulfide isomerase/thioredoxin
MLTYLTPNDYFITQQNELANKIPGFSFIFFSSSGCKFCKDVMPSFLRLSQILQGCVFGIMNVDQEEQKIVSMSASTKNKLEFVPYVLLYVNGKPLAPYMPDEDNPDANFEKMKTFLIAQTTSLNSGDKPTAKSAQIPPYAGGIPGNLKRVCYFSYDRAYGKN